MSGYRFARSGGEWAQESWRALDRAVLRWVRAHGGSERLAATAAWASLADGNGDSALRLAQWTRLGMPPLDAGEIDALRAEAMVAGNADGAPRPFVIDAADRFYLWRNFVHERDAALRLRARRADVDVDATANEADIDTLFHGERGAQVAAQRSAVRAVVGRRLFVLTGGPGTGKTTTVLRMLLMLQRRTPRPLAIRIAAPTGKAAQRLVQALRRGKAALRAHAQAPLPADWLPLLDAIPDSDALTVHRLLGYEPWRNAFARSAQDPVAADVVVIDEASMVDLSMLHALLEALPASAILILVGDADQLTSVAAGSVLMDVVGALEADAAGDLVRLQHSFRAQDHLVAVNEALRRGDADAFAAAIAASAGAVQVRDVETPRQLGERLAQWARALAATLALRPLLGITATGDATAAAARDAQVATALGALARRQLLCALREGPAGALEANAALERVLRRHWQVGDDSEWYPGRAVIVTRNDYAAGLFNGDVGLCLGDADGHLQVWFEAAGGSAGGVRAFAPNALPLHETAFAITIHKSQGSEYDDVAVLLPADGGNRILSRQLLYTAVSRARQRVELWCTPGSLQASLERPIERQGGLRERLASERSAARTRADSPIAVPGPASGPQLGFGF
jgi:exodeoxyribonuclease V alpha subunit